MQYCSLQHWTLLLHQSHPQLRVVLTLVHCFFLSGAISNCPLLFPSSILYAFRPGDLSSGVYRWVFQYCPWGSPEKKTGVGCHFLLWWTTFCCNSSLWHIHLGWPCMAWLIASLSYTSPFTTTRLWSTQGR